MLGFLVILFFKSMQIFIFIIYSPINNMVV